MSRTTAVKIEKFVIEIADTKIEMTKGQAEELRDLLINLLGDKSETLDKILKEIDRIRKDKIKDPSPFPIPYPVPYPQPYPVPVRPWIVPKPWWEPSITWRTSSGVVPEPMYKLTCSSKL